MLPEQTEEVPPELQPLLAGEVAGSALPDDLYRDKSPAACLRSYSFWLLFFSSAVCSGSGLTLLNNTAQMVRMTETHCMLTSGSM